MGKKTWSFILILLLILNMTLFVASTAKAAGVSVAPAKLTIEMNNGYPTEDIEYNIEVTNPYSYDIQASERVILPWDLNENYMVIPDLSWLSVSPETIDIPARSSNEFGINLEIPDEEKPLHFNESWEAWILIIPHLPPVAKTGQVGIDISTRYAIRILIKTPPEEQKMETPQTFFIFLIGLVGFIVLSFVYFFVRRRRILANRAAIFYIKKKNGKK